MTLLVGNVLTFQNQQRHMACHSNRKGKQLATSTPASETLTAARSRQVPSFHPNQRERFSNLYPGDYKIFFF